MCHTFSTLLFRRKFSILCASSMGTRRLLTQPHTDLSPFFLRNICYKFFMAFHYHCCVFISPLFCQWHSGKSARNYKRRKFSILNIRALNYPQGLTDDCFESKKLFILRLVDAAAFVDTLRFISVLFPSRRENIASFSVRETEVKH